MTLKQVLSEIRVRLKQCVVISPLGLLAKPFLQRAERFVWFFRYSDWVRQHPPRLIGPLSGGRFDYRPELFKKIVETENLKNEKIAYLEFGVYRGKSIRWFCETNTHSESKFVGFDTFYGLPELWNKDHGVGHFSTKGELPNISDTRCSFKKGLFQDTLNLALDGLDSKTRLVVHLDADLFSSTLYVLMNLGHLLKEGDLLLFDEFCVPRDEFRAFTHFQTVFNLGYEVLGVTRWYDQVAIKITSTRAQESQSFC